LQVREAVMALANARRSGKLPWKSCIRRGGFIITYSLSRLLL
jgi:hypothetical protein